MDRLYDFLRDSNLDAARAAIEAIVRAIDSLVTLPDRGRTVVPPDVRELIVPFGRSSYVIRYVHAMSANEIVIIRIWHGREARE